MLAIITDLKKEHHAILNALNQIENLGPSSHQGQQLLSKLFHMIQTHHSEETALLAPILKKQSELNPELAWLIDTFAEDIQQIMAVINQFYKDLNLGISHIRIASEFAKIQQLLISRFHREENIFYQQLQVSLDDRAGV